MAFRALLRRILVFLLPLSIASALYLYLYPVFGGCAFPLPQTRTHDHRSSFASIGVVNTLLQHAADYSSTPRKIQPEPAVFRLLVLADPQIEGDTSLPDPENEFLPRLQRHWEDVRSALLSQAESTQNVSNISIVSNVSEASNASIDNSNETHGWDEGDETGAQSVASVLKQAISSTIYEDIPLALWAARKRLDLFGNDYYLAHIYRTLFWWSRPTHVTVLGDLIGSQWVTDEEFDSRGWRYWHRVFRGGQKVSDDLTITGNEDLTGASEEEKDTKLEPLQRYNSSWARRIINVVGNHDIGYAGDVSRHRLERFERVFGPANWDIRYQHPPITAEGIAGENADADILPTLHIINLNDLTLDGPAYDTEIQSDSYTYINDLISHRSYPVEDQTSFTLLLTHVPLHKRDGICVDGPLFEYFEEDDTDSDDDTPRFRKDGLREQNHLSEHVSNAGILQGIYGMSGDTHAPANGRGRRGLILTGHDHEGCDVVHYINRTALSSPDDYDSGEVDNAESWHWDAARYSPSAASSPNDDHAHTATPSIREVTLRSMMGEYGGNAALLSLWFDPDPQVNEWRYEIQMCPAGVQHIWWAVHGLALACSICLVLFVTIQVMAFVLPAKVRPERSSPEKVQPSKGKKPEGK